MLASDLSGVHTHHPVLNTVHPYHLERKLPLTRKHTPQGCRARLDSRGYCGENQKLFGSTRKHLSRVRRSPVGGLGSRGASLRVDTPLPPASWTQPVHFGFESMNPSPSSSSTAAAITALRPVPLDFHSNLSHFSKVRARVHLISYRLVMDLNRISLHECCKKADAPCLSLLFSRSVSRPQSLARFPSLFQFTGRHRSDNCRWKPLRQGGSEFKTVRRALVAVTSPYILPILIKNVVPLAPLALNSNILAERIIPQRSCACINALSGNIPLFVCGLMIGLENKSYLPRIPG